jgi:hypothetical protein
MGSAAALVSPPGPSRCRKTNRQDLRLPHGEADEEAHAAVDAAVLDRVAAGLARRLVVLVFPFGLDWFGYGISIAFAVAFAAWARPRYRVTVLERSDRGVVYWVRRVKKGEEKAQEQPPPATDSPSRLDQPFPSAEALRRSGAPPPS